MRATSADLGGALAIEIATGGAFGAAAPVGRLASARSMAPARRGRHPACPTRTIRRSTRAMNIETRSAPPDKQALRLKRVLSATTTYALGFLVLSLCAKLGLLDPVRLTVIGIVFVGINVVFLTAIRSGWNLRYADPSMTLAQVLTAIVVVAFLMVMGNQVQFLAVPFYSSIFVFAMLKLKPRQLLGVEAFVLLTYCGALAIRVKDPAGNIDPRLEAVNFVLVVLSSVWYTMAAAYISNLRARLRTSVQTIEQLAIRDGLCGTWNRRHIEALLGSELQRQERIGGPLCAALIDIDHFKDINDRYGHPAGDSVMKAIAACMQAQLRSIDQLGRFGGDEFLLLLPGTTLTEAQACAERLRRAVAATGLLPDGATHVAISIGLAECMRGESPEQCMARIDRALYRAKHLGRNRVEIDTQQAARAA